MTQNKKKGCKKEDFLAFICKNMLRFRYYEYETTYFYYSLIFSHSLA